MSPNNVLASIHNNWISCALCCTSSASSRNLLSQLLFLFLSRENLLSCCKLLNNNNYHRGSFLRTILKCFLPFCLLLVTKYVDVLGKLYSLTPNLLVSTVSLNVARCVGGYSCRMMLLLHRRRTMDEADCSPPREDVGASIEEVFWSNVRGLYSRRLMVDFVFHILG